MPTAGVIALVCFAAVGVLSAMIGSYGIRLTRTTSDFLVASRAVGPTANASAIAGEYLSAASFLGIAGLILRDGHDALYYPIAFVTGYLAMLLFVAAPLRRSGAQTVPDFVEMRLASPVLRRSCTAIVLVIGWLYLLPTLQGVGLTFTALTGLEPWTGIASAGVIVLFTVLGGGMRSITFVQAFQFWLKLVAFTVPAFVIIAMFFGQYRDLAQPAPPTFQEETTVRVGTAVRLDITTPVEVEIEGRLDGVPVRGDLILSAGRHTVAADTEMVFPEGSAVPAVAGAPTSDQAWLEPMSRTDDYALLSIYSILLAGFLGTMGLPHVLVRFYTNPDGRAARRTTVIVLGMIGVFYMCVVLVGWLCRLFAPQLTVTGSTDAAVLLLPTTVFGQSWLGWALGGLVAAGAAAAFLATASGLVVSLAGVLFTEIMRGRRANFRLAAVIATVVPLVLALTTTRMDFALAVPLVFAVAACTFCPLLVLGIWWRGLTATGALSGVLVGFVLSVVPVAASLAATAPSRGLAELMYRPAIITVPAAFLTMIVVSKLTWRSVPHDVDRSMLMLHAPEQLGMSRDRFRA